MKEVDKILYDRGETHGLYSSTSATNQILKEVIRNSDGWNKLSKTKKESLDLICLKISRIVNSDGCFKDHWVDIEGYAKLISKNLSEIHDE